MISSSFDFSFVTDEGIRRLLEDFSTQAEKSYAAGSYLGALVGFGAVAEGLLTWLLIQRRTDAVRSRKALKDKSGQVRPLEEWNLTNLIDVAVELKLLGETAAKAAWALKDFRNFIHPYRLAGQSARPDLALATSAQSALAEIRRSVAGRITK